MAVAFQAASQSGPEVNPNWSHASGGTPRAALVWVTCVQGLVPTSVTYGGVPMALVRTVNKSATESGSVHFYFLGSGIPTGTQTIAINLGGEDGPAHAITLTASADTEVVDHQPISSNSVSNPRVTLSLGGKTSFVAVGFQSGQGAVSGITPITGWTGRFENDLGAATTGLYSYNTIGTADVSAGWNQSADDAIAIAVAISEASSGISGSLNVTLGALTLAAAGVVAIAGAAAPTLGALTGSAQATVEVRGSASPTLGALTLAAAGTVGGAEILGELDATLGALQSSATGAVAISGSASRTLDALSASATGTVGVRGATSSTLGALISSAQGAVEVRGAAAQTFGELTAASAGTVEIRGAANSTLDALSSVATGAVAVTGTMSATLGALTMVASDAVPTPSTLDVMLLARYGIIWTGQEIL